MGIRGLWPGLELQIWIYLGKLCFLSKALHRLCNFEGPSQRQAFACKMAESVQHLYQSLLGLLLLASVRGWWYELVSMKAVPDSETLLGTLFRLERAQVANYVS
jgi:hypothetical protein